MPDILLVQPPIRDFYLTAKRTIPYGLACIAAALQREGFSVGILDALAVSRSKVIAPPETLSYLQPYYGREDRSPFALFHHYRHYGYSFQHLARRAGQAGAFLVGISALFTPYAGEAVQTAAVIKQACPEARIVLGGHHATALPETVLAHPAVDFVLRGDGEVGLPALAKALQNKTALEKVPGIAYRRPDGSLDIHPPVRIESIEDFQMPALELLHQKHYSRNGHGSAVIVTCRGCPLGCSYCALRRSKTIRRPVVDVMRELETAVTRLGVRFIDFEDENLSLDGDWFETLLQAIIERFGPYHLELRAMNGLYPPALKPRQIRLMTSAGFKVLNLALATTCPDQLRRFKRADVGKDFERVLELAEHNGLQAVAYVIVGAPHQSAKKSVDDLLYLAGRRVLAGVSVFYPAPGSLDFKRCRRERILPGSFEQMRAAALPLSHTTSRTASATLLRLGRILNFMKRLKDRGASLPVPVPFTPGAVLDPNDRTGTGQRLLQHFLHDGIIRGVTSNGTVYEHLCDEHLTNRFIAGLGHVDLKGTRGITQ